MYRRGFTIVELIIVISILGILLVLGVVNLRGSQASARDTERIGDVEILAQNFESYYRTGNYALSEPSGSYPSTVTSSATNAAIAITLPDIDPKALSAPGITDATTKALVSATNATQTAAGVTPQPTINTYVYQPIKSDATLCPATAQICRKFNIYYKLETATTDCPAPDNICIVSSKNQ